MDIISIIQDSSVIQTWIKIVVFIFLFVMPLAILMTLFERKWSALIQDRIGPNRANVGSIRLKGVLHIVADGLKAIFKEDFIAKGTNKVLFTIAPYFGFFAAFVIFSIIPVAGPIGGFHFQITDVDSGMLMILALTSLGAYGAVIAGWSTENKYGILGSVRSSAQVISYEVFLGLAIVGLFLVHGSLRVNDIVAGQNEYWFGGWIPKWGIFTQPLGFLLFFIALIAETKRAPFDAPEGESEIIAGYFIEYSGMRFASFFVSEYVSLVGVSVLMTTLFLGSYHLPWLHADGFHFGASFFLAVPMWLVAMLQFLAFFCKTFFFCWLQLVIRWSVPRFRFDQTMRLGWKRLMPIGIANIMLTAIVLTIMDAF